MLKKTNRVFLLLIILLQIDFFSLFSIPSIISSYNGYFVKYLSLSLIFMILIINMCFKNSNTISNFFGFPIMVLLISVLIITLTSTLRYNQNFFQTISSSYYYLTLLLYYFFSRYFSSKDEISFLMNTIKNVGAIYAGILIIQIIWYFKTGQYFLDVSTKGLAVNGYVFPSNITGSFSLIPRIQRPADFIVFSFLIQNIIMCNKRWRFNLKDIVFYVLEFSYILFISQTRMYILFSVLCLLMLVLMKLPPVVRKASTVLALFLILIFHSFILSKVGFFDENRTASTLIRSLELKYYLPLTFSNWGMGLGFANDTQYYLLNHGVISSSVTAGFYTDDIGILGIIVQLGIFGVIIVGLFIIYLSVAATKLIKNNAFYFMYLYLIVTSISLSLLNVQRIFYFPIILFLITDLLKNKESAL